MHFLRFWVENPLYCAEECCIITGVEYKEVISLNKIERRSERTLGILCILCAAFCFSLMSVFIRLAGSLPTMQKIFFRNLVAALAAFIMLAREGNGFRIRRDCLGGHAARCITGFIGMIANFWAIDHIGIADANMLNKLSPFFALLMSMFVLHEYPKRVDILSVVVAFIGAVFVVRPGAGLASLPALVGVLGGLGAGTAYTFVRQMTQKGERGTEIVMVFSLFTCVMSLPFFIVSYQPMTASQWVYLLLAGCAAAGGQLSITAAYRHAPAKEISVFDYSQIVYAALWGYFLFGEIPDAMSILGYVIIIGAAVFRCLYNLRADRRRAAVSEPQK